MKSRKMMLALSLTVGVVLSSSFPAFAQGNMPSNDNKEVGIISGVSEVSDSKTIASEVLTFDEVVERIAKDNNISKSKAAEQVVASFDKNVSKSSELTASDMVATSEISAYTATYRILSSQFTVNASYKPSLNFYCQTDEGGGSFRAIIKVINVSMNRSYNGFSKQFSGNVFTFLEDANRIYWQVDGDFFDNGTTTGGGAVNLNAGDSVSLNFNVSYASNWYDYVYTSGYYYF